MRTYRGSLRQKNPLVELRLDSAGSQLFFRDSFVENREGIDRSFRPYCEYQICCGRVERAIMLYLLDAVGIASCFGFGGFRHLENDAVFRIREIVKNKRLALFNREDG